MNYRAEPNTCQDTVSSAERNGTPNPDQDGTAATTAEVDAHLTDVGNAKRFARDHADSLRWCDPWGRWLYWDGRRWKEDDCRAVDRLAKQTIAGLYAEAVERMAHIAADLKEFGNSRALRAEHDRWAKHQQWALKSEDAKKIGAMLALARSELAVTPAELNRHPWLLNCANGTLDLRTGELRDPQRADYLTQLCPTEHDPGADCPSWSGFLDKLFPPPSDSYDHATGNDGLIAFVQRLLGCCLTGDVSEQLLPILWGGGSNGKSTLLNVMLKVLGDDYALKAPQTLLMAQRGERHPTELASLFSKRLVMATETAEGDRLNETAIKEMTGSERVSARKMRQDFWEFDPTHKVFLATNHKPKVRGTDHAIWRRLRLVPFTVTFWNPDEKPRPGEERPDHLRQDKALTPKLLAEAPGILAWMVRGCLDWQRDGLTCPPEVAEATEEYRKGEDKVSLFLEDRCVTGTTHYKVRASVLYAAFCKWMEASNERAIPSATAFGLRLPALGFEKYTSNGVWYKGLALRDDGPPGDGPEDDW